jgi:hypothetical protein
VRRHLEAATPPRVPTEIDVGSKERERVKWVAPQRLALAALVDIVPRPGLRTIQIKLKVHFRKEGGAKPSVLSSSKSI